MEDWKIAVGFLKELVQEMHPDLPVIDRSALYGGATSILDQLRAMVVNDYHGDAYALEKIQKARWSIAAALGIDYGNGHEVSSHHSWAYGSLDSLTSHLNQMERHQ